MMRRKTPARKNKTEESKFQTLMKKRLEDLGALVFNVHGHGHQEPGWPDLQVYHITFSGRVVHLELKYGDNRPSVNQMRKLKTLVIRGVAAYVLRKTIVGTLRLETRLGKILRLWDNVRVHDINWIHDLIEEMDDVLLTDEPV